MTKTPAPSSPRRPGRAALLAALLSAGVAGCSIPMPEAAPDPTRFYVLSAGAVAGEAPAAGAPTVYLRDVDVAEYLRSRPIIVRRGEHEIEFREFARWGEPLEVGIARVLREELLARGAASSVLRAPVRSPGIEYDRELRVRVLAAEGTAEGGVEFRAAWEVATPGARPEVVARGEFRAAGLSWDRQAEGTLVASLSDAVAGLAAEIAAALGRPR